MKATSLIAISFVVAVFSAPAFAHDPREHQKEAAAAADCVKMKDMDMDMSKMDSNDPVMKAMQKKCKEQKEHEAMEYRHDDAKNTADGAKSAAQPTADAAKKKPNSKAADCAMDMSKMDMSDPTMKAMHDKCMKQ